MPFIQLTRKSDGVPLHLNTDWIAAFNVAGDGEGTIVTQAHTEGTWIVSETPTTLMTQLQQLRG